MTGARSTTSGVSRGRVAVRAVLVAGLVLASIGVVATPASGLQFDVTNGNDSGPGSLRQAIADAEANPGGDDIVVDAGVGLIELDSEIVWNGGGNVTIDGNGVTIDAGGSPRGLVDNAGQGIVARDFALTGVAGSLMFTDVAPIISQGGGMVLEDCDISDNSVETEGSEAAGAVLSEGGGLTITDCTMNRNSAVADSGEASGAVLNEGGGTTIDGCEMTDNTGTAFSGEVSGGMNADDGGITIRNCVIDGNTAFADSGEAGGGVLNQGGGTFIEFSAIVCNTAEAVSGDAGGGVAADGGGLSIENSLVAANLATATDGTAENNIWSVLPPALTDVEINDDASICIDPTPPPPPPPPPDDGGDGTVTPAVPVTPAADAVATDPTFTG